MMPHGEPLCGVGIAFTTEPRSGSEGSVFDTLVRGSRYVGIAVIGSRIELGRVVVDATEKQLADGKYGDGISVSAASLVEAVSPASVVTTDVHVSGSARAAMSLFGGELSVRRAVLSCGGFDLEVSDDFTGRADAPNRPFAVADGGDTVCGCGGAWKSCKAQSSGLEPIVRP
jgi:hypothetical protein